MGLQSAMTTALTGLQGAEATIDVVGNNVANSNTVGFKESSVLFATQFLQTQSIGSSPTTSSGGTNPRQVGLGVKVSEIAPNFTQGTIQVSANPLDLAIQGDGFFVVQGPNGGSQQFFTRNGQFKTNAVNELVSVGGDRVLGYGVNDQFVIDTNTVKPISIPFGGSAVAQETNNVTLAGNLLPNGAVSTQPGIIDSAILNDNSVEAPTDFGVNDLQQVSEATTATVAANAPASGVVDAGSYTYKVAFVDPTAVAGHDESPASQASLSVTSDGTQSVDLNNLPTASDPAVYTMKRIYRSDGTGDYKLVAEIPQGDVTYTDNATNASLATAPSLNDESLDLANYSYFVTFSKPGLETRPTDESQTLSVSDLNHRIRLDNIPQPTDPSFTSINIYRSVKSEPGNYYLVDSLTPGQNSYIDSKPDSEITVAANLLDRNGPPVNTATQLTKVATFNGTDYVDLFQPGTLQFTGSKGTGSGLDLGTKSLTITGTTTVQDLINFMQQALGIQLSSPDPAHPLTGSPGGSLTSSQLRFESNEGENNSVSINQNAFKLTTANGDVTTIPLNFSSVQDATGAGTSSEITAYDSLGIPMNVRLTTALESTSNGVTRYRWFATSDDNQPASGVGTTVGTGLITLDGDGKFSGSTSDTVTIDRRDVASNSPVTFDLDFSQVTAVSPPDGGGTGQLQASTQDGFAAGTLTNFTITQTGRIKGTYSNGVTRDLGQLLMARFNNPGGLQQVGDNLYAEGVNSGEPLRDIPGASGIGSLTSGAVELSNTDIGQNLIDLILASTQYRGGTRVITSAQQLLEDLLNLQR
ncbi:MAG TPA: flagellar hook-basal body complex protein [Lacipirellulaceae bacterium]|nr:flagellar hook-basal body complex protein [Lacipirellulaceae bacterium]